MADTDIGAHGPHGAGETLAPWGLPGFPRRSSTL
jgi:hypothetical protein